MDMMSLPKFFDIIEFLDLTSSLDSGLRFMSMS